MVYFVCDGCNETLKRGKVEGHLYRCPSHGVTCVDCNVTFDRYSYLKHSTCISEAEKYEGASSLKKKKSPQDEWNDLVANCASRDAPNTVAAYLPRLADLSNVPRNRKKFKNFLANSLRIRDAQVADQIYDFLSSQRPAPAMKEEKRKREEEEEDPVEIPHEKEEKSLDESSKKEKKKKKKKRRKE